MYKLITLVHSSVTDQVFSLGLDCFTSSIIMTNVFTSSVIIINSFGDHHEALHYEEHLWALRHSSSK